MTETDDEKFHQLLSYLRRTRGFDSAAYKRSSLQRRIARRRQSLGLAGYAEYGDYLEVHPDEFEALFNTILINVTDFFRDPPAWEIISDVILPQILAQKKPSEPIRVWSAGCAAGQEAYSIAMLLAEQLGEDELRDRVKIFATDLDEDALSNARHATYTAA